MLSRLVIVLATTLKGRAQLRLANLLVRRHKAPERLPSALVPPLLRKVIMLLLWVFMPVKQVKVLTQSLSDSIPELRGKVLTQLQLAIVPGLRRKVPTQLQLAKTQV